MSSEPNQSTRQVATSKEYYSQRFHLFQLVVWEKTPTETTNYIVTNLNDGLTLSTTDFEFETEYDGDGEDLTPQTTNLGTPVFGY
jgi:hypothetical protein